MTLLIWLAVSSLLWGAVLWMTGRVLQRSGDVSGRARQVIWRGATLLLLAPWVAAPFVVMFGLGLAPPETVAEMTVATVAPQGETLAAMHVLDLANVETAAVVSNGGTVFSAISALSLFEIVALIVIAGWLVRFVSAQMALRSLLGIVMMSRPAEKGRAMDAVKTWAGKLRLRRAPRLRIVEEQHSPFSYGVLRPTICLPEGLERKLSHQSLDLVVGHESLHVARGDGWLRPLERVPADVLWFNPFAWLIRRELDVARELAVDEAVVAMAESRVAYARTLRDVAGFSAGLSAAAPAASMSLAGGRNLMLRVSRTLSQAKRKPARAVIIAACLMGVVGAPMAIAQVMLAVPAPPAAPEAPEAPAAIEAMAAVADVEAAVAEIEAPEAPEAPQPPEAPEAPEDPPAAEVNTKDGKVRATFSGQVTKTSGDLKNGFNVELLQLTPGATGELCLADMKGLGSLKVTRGQTIAAGDVIGDTSKTGSMSFTVSCSDEVDSAGRPRASVTHVSPEPRAAADVDSQNGQIRASFNGKVTVMSGDAQNGFNVQMLQVAPDVTGEVCVADLGGLGSLNVGRGQVVSRGDLVGSVNGKASLKFSMTCSDELDGQGRPMHQTPPAPPAPPAPVERVAPVSPPSPVTAPAPVAPVAPPKPPGKLTAVAPLAPLPPSPAPSPSPLSAPTPPTPPTLATPPSPAPPKPLKTPISGQQTHPIVDSAVRTMTYGAQRDAYSQQQTFHTGVDLAAYKGAPIRAPEAGTILRVDPDTEQGKTVEMLLANGYVLRFARLDAIKVAAGDTVNAGTVLGLMGSSGKGSTGPHLHLEVVANGQHVNPEAVPGLRLATALRIPGQSRQ